MLLNNERAFEKWLKFEYHNINKNLVIQKVSIADLLEMENPKVLTKEGEEYTFNIASLQKLGKAIPAYYHRQLKLPITFYKDLRVKDSCFITDDIAIKALQQSNDLDQLYRPKDDKVWLSRPLAHEIANKYPTLVQFVIY